MIHIAWFLIGAVFGIVVVIVIACCAVDSAWDRREEQWYEEKYMEDSKDNGDNSTEAR